MPQPEPQIALQSSPGAERPEPGLTIGVSRPSCAQLAAFAEPAAGREMELVQRLRERLASYQANLGWPLEPGTVPVSFECLIEGEAGEIGRVAGLVAL